ncbi:MAG TPA: hypothetical protein EYP85_02095 [Armatimonadetes bacterium]|nr:hypothetical protein [Armatimonadota bacterium]
MAKRNCTLIFRPPQGCWRDGLCVGGLLVAAGLFLHPVVFGGHVLLPDYLLWALPWAEATSLSPETPWNPLWWDSLAQYYPWRVFAARHLWEGIIPLWNPHQFCGMPFLANGQSALLYPFTWLFFLLLAPASAFGWSALLHLFLAGAFTFAFLRRLHTSRSAALAGAVTFMFCGFLVAWLLLPPLVNTAVWLPAICWGLETARQRRSLTAAALAGGALGMAAWAGHLQIFAYVTLAALGYGLCRLAGRGFRLLLTTFALGGLLAAGQLLPTLELVQFSHRQGQPTLEGYQGYLSRAIPPANVVTAFVPDFFGRPAEGTYRGLPLRRETGAGATFTVQPPNPGDYSEFVLYFGVLPWLLGLYAMCVRRDPPTYFFLGLALFALLLIFGGSPNALFYFHLPGFAGAGGPGRMVVLLMFSLAILTGLGLDQLRADERRWVRWRLAGMAGLGLVLAGGSLLYTADVLRRLGEVFGSGWLLQLWHGAVPALWRFVLLYLLSVAVCVLQLPTSRGGRLVTSGLRLLPAALIFLDLFLWGHRLNPTSPPEVVYPPSETFATLQTAGWQRVMPVRTAWRLTRPPAPVLPPNTAMVPGLYDVQGYDSLYLRWYKELINAMDIPFLREYYRRKGRRQNVPLDASPAANGNMLFTANYTSPLLDLLGVRYVLVRWLLPPESQLRLCTDGWLKVYENPGTLPRAWGVYRAEVLPDQDRLLTRLFASSFDPRQTVLLEALKVEATGQRGNGAVSKFPSFPTAEFPGCLNPPAPQVTIEEYTVNRVRLAVSFAASGWVVMSDVYYPGWRAYFTGTRDEGREAGHWDRLERANYAFRAVRVEPEVRAVTLVYQPQTFRLGLFLTLGGIGGLGLVVGLAWKRGAS